MQEKQKGGPEHDSQQATAGFGFDCEQGYLHAWRPRHKLWTFPAAPLSRMDSLGRKPPPPLAPARWLSEPGLAVQAARGCPTAAGRGQSLAGRSPRRRVQSHRAHGSSVAAAGLGRGLHADGHSPGGSDLASTGPKRVSLTGGRQ